MSKIFDLKPKYSTYTKEEYIIIHQGKKPNKTVMNHNITQKQKNQNINKKSKKRIFTTFCILLFLIGATCFTANEAGFLPIKPFMSVYEPIGKTGEIKIDEYLKTSSVITAVPALDRVKYKIFTSDRLINSVAIDYKSKLSQKGYSLKYSGTETIRGIRFSYFGFVKGISVIGIVMTKDGTGLFGQQTVVLYTTGSIFDYNKIINWYQNM